MPPTPQALKLVRTLEFAAAPEGRTFYYHKRRNEPSGGNLPVLEPGWIDEIRFRRTPGPFLYAVSDQSGATRYIGKSWEDFLCDRWIRPKPHLHHRESRDHIIAELRSGRGPLMLWSTSAQELRPWLPASNAPLSDRQIVAGAEAECVNRWFDQLWNHQRPKRVAGFSDGEYWSK